MRTITSRSDKAERDLAIRLPETLKSNDGRTFHIRNWKTETGVGDPIVLTAEMLVSIENTNAAKGDE